MLKSLRSRLILSHLIPILLLVPLLSILLIYLLQTRYALNDTANELAVQGELIARLTGYEWQSLRSGEQGHPLMAQLQVQVPARIFVTDRNGNLMVTTGTATASTAVELTGVNADLVRRALTGEIARQVHYGLNNDGSAVDVAVPIMNDEQEIVGAVQLTQQLSQIEDRLGVLRYLVFGTFGVGMVLAGILSIVLTRSLNRPLEQLTAATRLVRFDRPPVKVSESGPQEVRTLAHTFNAMAERLYDLEQGRRRLLRSVVHELGRPLGAIKAAAQVLGREHDPEPGLVVELAEGIDEQVDQLRRLLDDLALLAQSDVHELELTLGPVDLAALLFEECRRNGARMESRGIAFQCHIAENLPTLTADPMRLSQIVGNLLDNAQKYTPSGGAVFLQARTTADAIEVWVEDTGPGIDPSEAERIFQFFYRAPNQSRVQEGMGIGLALARRLAEAHGGTLRLDTSVERGARFILMLPV